MTKAKQTYFIFLGEEEEKQLFEGLTARGFRFDDPHPGWKSVCVMCVDFKSKTFYRICSASASALRSGGVEFFRMQDLEKEMGAVPA